MRTNPRRPHRLFAVAISLAIGASALADRVTLPTGETLEVEILEATPTGFKAKHAILGEIDIPRDGVTIVNAANQPIEPPPPPPPPSPWKFSFAVGGGLSEGNTQNANVSALFDATYEAGSTRFKYDAGYWYSSADGSDTENRFSTGALAEFDIDETKWFWGASLRFDYDTFQSWEYRLTGHVFAGYRILEEDPFTLNARAGLGFLKEFKSNNDNWELEGLLGLDGKWTLTESSAIVWNTTYFPTLTDLPQFRWVSNIGWTTALNAKKNLNLLIAFNHEYQSDVASDRKHNDFRLTFNIQATW
ncbi:MAG: DUF481 domain-containing protein [Phycisphaerales bacterium]|nr:DUF481 domain-containing protein [Phycisphaerales bacterium]